MCIPNIERGREGEGEREREKRRERNGEKDREEREKDRAHKRVGGRDMGACMQNNAY